MKGLPRAIQLGFSRVRVQILVGTLVTICTILISTGLLSYHSISELIRENTDRYVQNVVDQSVNSLDALLSQVDILSFQITNDQRIQNALLQRKQDGQIPLETRLLVRKILDEYMLNNTLITTLELYADEEAIFPVSGRSLQSRIGTDWVQRVNDAGGKLIWSGIDPNSPQQIMAIRKIILEQDSSRSGGYVVVKVEKRVSSLLTSTLSGIEGGSAFLFNQLGQVVESGGRTEGLKPPLIYEAHSSLTLGKGHFLPVRQHSRVTGWALVVLVPLNKISEGLHILKNALLMSGLLGVLLALVFTQALSSLVTHPVRKLMKVMRSTRQDIPVKNSEVYYTLEMNELNQTYNRMVDRIENLVETVYEKELKKSQAELRALQAQINPHFLYNTLEAFYWNIKEKEDEELAEKVIALSSIFRYTVKGNTDREVVAVAEEVNHVNQYMLLMLMRIGHRVAWRMNIDDQALDVSMPKLILQPLVENAIHHGIEGGEGTGCVTLTITMAEEEVHIIVHDDGKGMNPHYLDHAASGTSRTQDGIALANIHRRLQMMYGQEYGLHIESQPSRGTAILFRIPVGGG